jgi:thiamine biosynthesis lipoprotein
MAAELYSQTFSAFNTINTISIDDGGGAPLHGIIDLCSHFEQLFSHTLPGSDLVRINESAGKLVQVDPELARFIETALAYCRDTDGMFDITMGSVVRLWDFAKRKVPSKDTVQRALPHVDYRRVFVEGDRVRLDDPDACIVLGGIAKGYIADGICAELAGSGVKHAMVNLGGNVVVMGGKPDGNAWNIGLRMPEPSARHQTERIFAAVSMHDGSVVTSGIYERAFAKDGRMYHHILDPRTGQPADTDLSGATIVSEKSIDGDGYSTALVIMGAQRATAFVESKPGLEAVFTLKNGTVTSTSGIGSRVPFRMAE